MLILLCWIIFGQCCGSRMFFANFSSPDLGSLIQVQKGTKSRSTRSRIQGSKKHWIPDPDQGFRTGFRIRIGSGLDPYSIGPVNPDPDSESGSGSRRAKMTHKSRKNLEKFMLWSVGWPLLRAEVFFCNLDILYGGLGIGKLQFLIKKNFFFQL